MKQSLSSEKQMKYKIVILHLIKCAVFIQRMFSFNLPTKNGLKSAFGKDHKQTDCIRINQQVKYNKGVIIGNKALKTPRCPNRALINEFEINTSEKTHTYTHEKKKLRIDIYIGPS